ncbi:nuclease-related domain-containing protein [Pseudoalteromonas phenolica]|uniref:nuclease-related domain-containing protein n=1 Tax=Pseudoalteromonas phenolica TaxID=161398 RepID=UPI00110BB254|nr:nuclease-related domain-containing protein [Pseudoalteromonas phenolica]TMO52527.1 hypothetical protein CWC21_21875 [Pseudoalteromonas phenolica]
MSIRIALFIMAALTFSSTAFQSNLSHEQCARFYKEYQSVTVEMNSANGVSLQSLSNRYGRLQERLEAFCQHTEFSTKTKAQVNEPLHSESVTEAQRLYSDDIKQQAWSEFYTAPTYCLSKPLSSVNKLRCNNELNRFKELFEQQWRQNRINKPTVSNTKSTIETLKEKKLNTEVEPKSSVESTPTEVQAVKGNVSIGNKISNNDLVMNQNFQTPTTGLDTLFVYIDDYLYFIAVLITALILIKYLRPVAKKLFTRHFNYVAINKYLSKHLSVDDYTLYSKISLPIPSGMADIDELVLSPYGVFVISCQPQTGRIYADTTSEVWSEQIGKNRNNFPSPSRQLPMKLAGVKQLFGIEEHIHGLIVFDQEADFRTNMPKNVFQTGQLLSRIQSYEDKIFTQEQISHFVLLLSEYKSSNPFKDLFSKLGEKKSQNSGWEN